MEGCTREQLEEAVRRKIRRPLLAALTGDHLTGVARQQAAYAIAGVMLVPVRELLGLRPITDLKERQVEVGGWPVQLRFHELRPALDRLARSQNTEALEELFSPHVVVTGPEHEELKRVARGFLTRACLHDVLARAEPHREALRSGHPQPLHHLLEAARLLLFGSHLLRTGNLESHLGRLVEEGEEFWLRPFLERQRQWRTRARLEVDEARLLGFDLDRLDEQVHEAAASSPLPEGGGSVTALDEFLVELRLAELREAVARSS